jgi:hypothetical protein
MGDRLGIRDAVGVTLFLFLFLFPITDGRAGGYAVRTEVRQG